ncbi:MAG: hypothetical protein LIP05_08465 [Tannerellaceae bacterium]|nr:hypothetical protein [Tannerellaceae bacterium]
MTEDDRQKIIAQAAALRVQAGALFDKALSELDKKELKDQKEKVDKLLEPYKDFAERRLDIEKKYNKDIEEMEKARTSENSDLIDRSIEQAKRNRTKEYEDLDKEISDSAQRSSKMLEKIFTEVGQQSKKQIESVITDAEQLLKVLTSGGDGESIGFTPEQIAAMQKDSALIQDLIQRIIDKKKELYDRGGLVSQFVGSFKLIKDALSLDDPDKKMDSLADGIENMLGSGQALVNVFGSLGDNLASIAELSGNDGLAAVAGTMQGIANTMSSAMEGAEAGLAIGGPWGAAIGAVVGGAMSVMSMAAEASARHKAALKEIEEAKLAYQRKYNLLLLQQKLLMEEASNIFGEKQIAKAANALEVYKEALAAYKAELQGDKSKMSFTEWITQDAGGTYAKKMQDYEKGIGALSSAQIVTGHKKTGLFGWGKGKDTYSGILDVYLKLIDETGRLDTAMAESILSTHKMDDETRNLIQSLIDLQDQADAAQEQLRDYLKETFGGLGDGIMDSITDAIITGGNDAWENFGKSGAAVLENLGKQLAYSLFFAGKFDKLQEQLESIYGSGMSEEQIANESMRLIGNFYNGIGSQMDAAQGFLEDWKRKASQYGFDLWNEEEETTTQTGRASAISTIIQDQANSIDGRLTMMQVHEASIDNKMDDIGNGIYQITDRLDQIVENTGSCDKRLEKIENCVEEIKRDGLKVK